MNSISNPSPDPNPLEERFVSLWSRCRRLNDRVIALEIYSSLVTLYTAPQRHYHSLDHLSRCLQAFDEIAAFAAAPNEVELALWFHDAVYTPGASDNELKSRELFMHWGKQKLAEPQTALIGELIMCTTHTTPPRTLDESLIVDIDLSSFAAEWPIFVQDSQNVRLEQRQTSDQQYYPAHARFLRGLLDRPRVFYSDYFNQRLEHQARANIQRILATLPYQNL